MTSLRDSRWIAVIFVTGLVISGAMVLRSQVAGDQVNLLALGWRLVEDGVWFPYGNPTTGAGVTPGGATAIVVGLPLTVWKHHRSPALLIWLSHILAYWLLDRWLRKILSPEQRLLFAVLYWLNPWRIYHSAFLWKPNYWFLFGALHLTTAYQLRSRPRFWPSFFHVLSVGLVMQLEVVALPLALASLFWWWKRYLKIHWPGAIAASAIVILSLVPWALAVLNNPQLMAKQKGYLGFGLLMLFPVYRGALYWVRYSSLALSTELFCLDFAYLIGQAAMARLAPLLEVFKNLVYTISLALSLWANYRFWRGSGSWWRKKYDGSSDIDWLIGVVRWGFVAAILIYCLAPSNIMRWHVLPVFQLAIIPPTLFFGRLMEDPENRRIQRGLRAYVTVTLAVVLMVAVGAPMVRCGGDRCGSNAVTMPPIAHDHPMFDALGIRATCPIEVDVPGGLWPMAFADETPQTPNGD